MLTFNQQSKLQATLGTLLSPVASQTTNQANLSSTFTQLSTNLIQQSQAEINALINNSGLTPIGGSYTSSCNPSWDNESWVLSESPSQFSPQTSGYSYDDGAVFQTACNTNGSVNHVAYARSLCSDNTVSNQNGILYCSNPSSTNMAMTSAAATFPSAGKYGTYFMYIYGSSQSKPVPVILSGSQYLDNGGFTWDDWYNTMDTGWSRPSSQGIQPVLLQDPSNDREMVLQYVGIEYGFIQFGCLDNDLSCFNQHTDQGQIIGFGFSNGGSYSMSSNNVVLGVFGF